MKKLDLNAARERGILQAHQDFVDNRSKYLSSEGLYIVYYNTYREDVERAEMDAAEHEKSRPPEDEVRSNRFVHIFCTVLGIILALAGAYALTRSDHSGATCALVCMVFCFGAAFVVRITNDAFVADVETRTELTARVKEHFRLIKTLTPPSA